MIRISHFIHSFLPGRVFLSKKLSRILSKGTVPFPIFAKLWMVVPLTRLIAALPVVAVEETFLP